jgi:hypothetical protein
MSDGKSNTRTTTHLSTCNPLDCVDDRPPLFLIRQMSRELLRIQCGQPFLGVVAVVASISSAVDESHILAASVMATLISTPRPASNLSQSCSGSSASAGIASRSIAFGGMMGCAMGRIGYNDINKVKDSPTLLLYIYFHFYKSSLREHHGARPSYDKLSCAIPDYFDLRGRSLSLGFAAFAGAALVLRLTADPIPPNNHLAYQVSAFCYCQTQYPVRMR